MTERNAVKIIILGAGQVGRTAAYHLSREQANEVTVVDVNEDILRDLQDRLDIRTVAGHASNPTHSRGGRHRRHRHSGRADQQRRSQYGGLPHRVDAVPHAEQDRTRTLAPTTPSATQLFGENALAVDVWISPEQLVTEYVARLIRYPGALQVLDFADGRVRLVGIRARREDRWWARSCARCASTSP